MKFARIVVVVSLTTVVCLSSILNAWTSPVNPPPLPLPNSITALAAINRARIAIRVARQKYQDAVAAARRQEVARLKIAEKHVMQRGNLKDAVLIQKWIAAVQPQIAHGLKFRIYATKNWQTTISLRKGESVTISASGRWSTWGKHLRYACGPDGLNDPVNHIFHGYLEGKIGNGKPFKIGDYAHLRASQDGRLKMQMYNYTGNLANDSGFLTVEVSR